MSIFPNPANSVLNIPNKQDQFQNAITEIINYFGQRILSESFSNQIDMSHFLSGVYIITIKTNSGELYHAKFVKE